MPAVHAVEVRNVVKTYRLYHKPVDRLKEALLRRPFHQPFQSLKDISLAVPAGETLGIVGENGAGKSTLLKVLAGTLTPTSGEVVVKGRVAALLELGAGFHPEFTGRQNIYLNASLLGLPQAEIRQRESAMIDFTELAAFIDRPIKTYSSGMVMRLAFSIATSVDPDILIIDEALSVGDQYFQKKCIDRMLAFREAGKTIIFCSHDMYTVNLLCATALWIDDGGIRQNGLATHVTAAYENYLREKTVQTPQTESSVPENVTGQDSPPVLVRSIILNGGMAPVHLKCGEELDIVLEYEALDDCPFRVAMGIRRNDGLICHAVSMAREREKPLRGKGVGRVRLRYPSLPLLHGEFTVVGSLLDESGLHLYHRGESSPFSIVPPDRWRNEVGLLNLSHEWEVV